jgi:hypothetical protein
LPKSQRALEEVDNAVLALLKISIDTVQQASQHLVQKLDVQEQQQLQKVQNELTLFFDFALDYWIQDSIHSQKEQHIVREALYYHWGEAAGGGHEGQAMINTLQERFKSYGQVVNEVKDDNAKLYSFGKKLSEFCGISGNPYVLLLAPHLFTVAMESVGVVLRVLEDRGGKKND